jgi:hypothetical protein
VGLAIEDSKTVSGVLGVRKDATAILTTVTASNASGAPGFPMNLSGIHRLRLQMYFDYESAFNVFQLFLSLNTVSGVDSSTFVADGGRTGNGWLFPSFDLDDPSAVTGSGVDLSNVVSIGININFGFAQLFISDSYGILISDLGYTQRDTGSNNGRGYHPGF